MLQRLLCVDHELMLSYCSSNDTGGFFKEARKVRNCVHVCVCTCVCMCVCMEEGGGAGLRGWGGGY